MTVGRMEAFSDGVLAIIITIMVLGLRAPHGTSLGSLRTDLPALLSYVPSFVNIGTYWNNHHHLLKTVERVTSGILWANLNLLFWLSLVPFTTSWMAQNHFAPVPVAIYGCILLLAGVAYFVLQQAIIAANGTGSKLATAVGRDLKGKLSMGLYAVAIPLTAVSRWLALALYVVVAVMWLIPDRRLAPMLEEQTEQRS